MLRKMMLAIVAVAGLCTASAQNEIEGTVGMDVVSRYIWRGQALGDAAVQPTATLSYKGLSLTAWSSFGFINKKGKVVIPCQWDDSGIFSSGLAIVVNEDKKCGYIDKKGKIVIPCKWTEAENFSDEHAMVKDENGNVYTIDKSGNVITKGHYEDFVDEEKGEVISIWVEDPESGE